MSTVTAGDEGRNERSDEAVGHDESIMNGARVVVHGEPANRSSVRKPVAGQEDRRPKLIGGTFARMERTAYADEAPRSVDMRAPGVEERAIPAATMQAEPAPVGGELLEHSLETYLTQLGRTPILNAGEEILLTRHIEQSRYVSGLQQQLLRKCGMWPTGAELLVVTLEHLAVAGDLFTALRRRLELPCQDTLEQALLCPRLRGAIDAHLEPTLIDNIAKDLGVDPKEANRALVQFSLASAMVPWHCVADLAEIGDLERLRDWVHSPERRQRLKNSELQLSRHFRRIHDDGQQAFEQLVRANVRLVVALARRYANADIPLIDLVQEGIIGLIRAATRFDHHRGHKFSTYATWWIRQSLGRALAEQSRPFRLPIHTVDRIGRLHKAEERLSQRYGHLPGRDELAQEMGIKPQKVDELTYAASPSFISLHTVIGDGEEETELVDLVEDKVTPSPVEQASENLLRQEVNRMLQSLAPRERRVVQLRFGFTGGRSHTLAETGAELGVSKQRVEQIEYRALALLRQHSSSGGLRDYLG